MLVPLNDILYSELFCIDLTATPLTPPFKYPNNVKGKAEDSLMKSTSLSSVIPKSTVNDEQLSANVGIFTTLKLLE